MGNRAPKVVAPEVGSLGYLGIKATNDELFDLLLMKSPLVLIAWILLALVPKWKYTFTIAQGTGLFFSLLYVLLFVDGFVNPIDMSQITQNPKFKTPLDCFYSLEGVHTLFSLKAACFGGWVHYVVFDLWTGIWITNDSIEKKVPQLLTILCLFFTMMLGPSGLLLYFVIRTIYLQSPKYLEKIKKMLSNGSTTTSKDKKKK